MTELKFTLQSEQFEEYLFGLHYLFYEMVQTMIDVYSVIQERMNAESLIPLDTGRLEESFRYDLVRQEPNFIEMHYVFDAVDPDNGFHYAEYQHELMYRGVWRYYMGSPSYYVRAKKGHPVGNHHRHGTRGTDHYLLKGVQGSESLMWTIIEQDYLSLFYGGIK